MPAFAFRAVDAAGKPQRGVLEASSPVGARRALRDRNLLPVSVVEARTASSGAVGARAAPSFTRLFRPRLGGRALADVTRQLSTLIGSDIRIEEALRLVAEQNARTPAGPLLLNVRGAVLEGRGFSEALSDHPDVFPEFFRASVAAGERSGKLADVLAHLTDFVEGRERTRQKIQLALLYPTLLAIVASAIIVLLLVYVVPDITRVFVARGAELPFITRALIGISAFVGAFGWVMALVVVAAGWGARQWLKTDANRLTFARRVAHTPGIQRFSRQLNAARFAGSLATLVRSDVPLVDALVAAAAVTPNRYIRQRALEVAARVREGASLHRAMTEAAVFPPMLLAVVASGETSGRLGHALGRASADLERDLDVLTAALVGLVEPAVLLLMGGVVLLMVLAILTPIVNLNNLAGT